MRARIEIVDVLGWNKSHSMLDNMDNNKIFIHNFD